MKTPDVSSAVAAVTLLSHVLAHSWVEQMTVVKNGSFVGNNGYPRSYVSRSDPGFTDAMMTHLIPASAKGRQRIAVEDLVCSPRQRSAVQSSGFPRLTAAPGDTLALKYLENGHVSLPSNAPGKPAGGGLVHVFGTSRSNETDTLMDVLSWTSKSTRGQLLASRDFDDTRCYQINAGGISTSRQAAYPDPCPGLPATANEQWCEIDVKLPFLSLGSTYTLYWVWDWPTANGTAGAPKATSGSGSPGNPLKQQDPQQRAVQNYRRRQVRSKIDDPTSS